jgi:hypothetical protein
MTDNAIAVYNAKEKKLIGIYRTMSLIAKVYFPSQPKQAMCIKIKYALSNKTKMKPDKKDYSIAVRYATKELIEQLGDKDSVEFDSPVILSQSNK